MEKERPVVREESVALEVRAGVAGASQLSCLRMTGCLPAWSMWRCPVDVVEMVEKVVLAEMVETVVRRVLSGVALWGKKGIPAQVALKGVKDETAGGARPWKLSRYRREVFSETAFRAVWWN